MVSGGSSHGIKRPAVVCVLAIIAILVNLGCLVFISVKYSQQQSHAHTPLPSDNDLVCVPCRLLVKNNDHVINGALGKTLTRRNDGGTERCCAATKEQITDLLEIVASNRKTEPKSQALETTEKMNGDLKQVSTHKQLMPSSSSAESVLRFPKKDIVRLSMNATYHDPLTEHVGSVDVLPSGLVALYSGLYYVYSEIYFTPRSSRPCSEFDDQTWNHTVTRSRPNERQSSGVILKSLHTCCDDCKNDKETSYTAGVFSLEAGDHLQVEVSAHGLVRFHKESSFLGVSMLGSLDEKK